MTAPPLISLLTDFGTADNYVGVMKGVMLRIAPQARFLDITHQISPQSVREGAYSLQTSLPYFPQGTIHLVVVDPGVGSDRRAVGVQIPGAQFIAPDNGVLSYVLSGQEDIQAVELANPAYHLKEISTTFHGRDIFSPAAAHLAAGVPLGELGPSVDDLVQLPEPYLAYEQGCIRGEVISIDHFGNLATSINTLQWRGEDALALDPLWTMAGGGGDEVIIPAARAVVRVGEWEVAGIAATFSAVDPGHPVAVVGSEGGLDLSLNQGNLAEKLGVTTGAPVTLEW